MFKDIEQYGASRRADEIKLTAKVQACFQSQLYSLGKSLHHSESLFCKKCTSILPILLTSWGYCDREMRNFKRKPRTFTKSKWFLSFIEREKERESLLLI